MAPGHALLEDFGFFRWCATPSSPRSTSAWEADFRSRQMLHTALFSMITLFTTVDPQVSSSDACQMWLQRTDAVAVAHGYKLETSKRGGLLGRSLAGTRLEANCEAGFADLRIIDAEGASASIEVTGEPGDSLFALQMSGDFPGFGHVARTHVIETNGSTVSGFANFSAAAADDFASVDFSSDGTTESFVGDANKMNAVFAPRLSKSVAWRDANRFLYGFAGMLEAMEDPDGGVNPAAMDGLFSFAVPIPHSEATDGDATHVYRVCGASGAACALTAIFPPALAACGAGSAGCLAALGCLFADCAGDD